MIRAILTDIEGTTSSIHFVKEVLFPYAASHMRRFLEAHWHDNEVRTQIGAITAETGQPVDSPAMADEILQEWIADDLKKTPLKALQGMIWESGYRNGDYRAHVYADAVDQLRLWKQNGIALFVYSSGSIQAQKLFFGFSEAGDLLPLFSGHFDTTSGPKQDAASYASISKAMGLPASEILFLSDIEAELDAASATGMHTCLLVRPADSSICLGDYTGPHTAVGSFADIRLSPERE